MKQLKKKQKVAAGICFAAVLILILFQNCSKGFETTSIEFNNIQESSSAPAACNFDGQNVPEGSSINAYAVSSVAVGQACVPEKRTCLKGALTGSAQFSKCEVGAPSACLFNGMTIQSGQSVMGYQSSTVPNGQNCVSENRVCDDGNLSGNFAFPSCTPAMPAMCLFNGTSIASGQSVKAYQTATVPYGQSCVEQTRACTDGTLSGEYTFSSCVAAAQPEKEITAIAAGNTHSCVVHKGALKCWGSNSSGQVGDGTRFDRISPVMIFPSGVTDVSIHRRPDSNLTTCAVVNSSLYCWGGQPWYGSYYSGSAPVKVIDGGVSKVAMSEYRICAIVNGKVLCSSFGNPSWKEIIETGATDIVSGQFHFCATVDASVKCWGSVNGDWGSGGTPLTDTPVTYVEGPTKTLGGAIYFACATLQNDDLYCFGSLPGLTAAPSDNKPVKIASAVSASTGSLTIESLAYVSNKQLYLYLPRGLGRIDGPHYDTPDYRTITAVPLFNNVDLISVGDSHVCASMDNKLYCFGDDTSKQSGNGIGFAMPSPTIPLDRFRVPL